MKSPESPVSAVTFDLGPTPLLAAGQSRARLVSGDHLLSHVVVVAQGGEITLHAHKNEEHIFLILAGKAKFSFANRSETILLGPLQGIQIPSDCFYSYCSIGSDNLVIYRVGTLPDAQTTRIGHDGRPLRGKSPEGGWKPVTSDINGRVLSDLFTISVFSDQSHD